MSDNDHRETLETYEACVNDGLRGDIVKREVGPAVAKLATDAYGEQPDVDSDSDVNDPSNATNESSGVKSRSFNPARTRASTVWRLIAMLLVQVAFERGLAQP